MCAKLRVNPHESCRILGPQIEITCFTMVSRSYLRRARRGARFDASQRKQEGVAPT